MVSKVTVDETQVCHTDVNSFDSLIFGLSRGPINTVYLLGVCPLWLPAMQPTLLDSGKLDSQTIVCVCIL